MAARVIAAAAMARREKEKKKTDEELLKEMEEEEEKIVYNPYLDPENYANSPPYVRKMVEYSIALREWTYGEQEKYLSTYIMIMIILAGILGLKKY